MTFWISMKNTCTSCTWFADNQNAALCCGIFMPCIYTTSYGGGQIGGGYVPPAVPCKRKMLTDRFFFLTYTILKVMAFHLSQPPRPGLMTPDMTLEFQEVCQAVRKSFWSVYFP